MLDYSFYVTPQEYEIAQQNGISYSNVNHRIREHGWHKKRAITEPPRKRRDLSEWKKIAESNGIGLRNMKSRLQRGWTIEDAATRPLIDMETQIQQMKQNNRKYPNVDEVLKEIGITYAAFTQRMRNGWTLEDAMSIKKMTKSESAQKAKGESYWSKGPSLFVKKAVKV